MPVLTRTSKKPTSREAQKKKSDGLQMCDCLRRMATQAPVPQKGDEVRVTIEKVEFTVRHTKGTVTIFSESSRKGAPIDFKYPEWKEISELKKEDTFPQRLHAKCSALAQYFK